MPKFIYVFSPEDRDRLLSLGYEQVAERSAVSSERGVFIFVNQKTENYALAKMKHILSDTLVF